MDKLLYLAGPLGCAVMMAAMMWMMRGHHGRASQTQPDRGTQEEIVALRAEVAVLRAQHQPTDQPQPTVHS